MRAGAVLVGLVTVTVLVPGVALGRADDDPCAALEPVAPGGTIAEPRLVELSGLAGSRQWSDVLWGHNDSGGAAELYAFDEDGTSLGAYPVEGAEAVDWEDMATGPAPDGRDTVLYIGDIGDNRGERPTVTVYRVHEPGQTPAPPGAPLSEVEAIELQYPGGPADAEALLVDPRTGDLVIVTKSLVGASRVLVAEAASLVAGEVVTMTDAGALRVPLPPSRGGGLPGTMVTGGDVSPDGALVVLRTYRSVLVFGRGDGQALVDALRGRPCFGPQEEERQGEAIAFTGDGTAYVTAGEGTSEPIHRVGLALAATTTTTSGANRGVDEEEGRTLFGVLLVTAVVLVAVGAAAVVVARRRRSADAG